MNNARSSALSKGIPMAVGSLCALNVEGLRSHFIRTLAPLIMDPIREPGVWAHPKWPLGVCVWHCLSILKKASMRAGVIISTLSQRSEAKFLEPFNMVVTIGHLRSTFIEITLVSDIPGPALKKAGWQTK